jgi:hypothetical protein
VTFLRFSRLFVAEKGAGGKKGLTAATATLLTGTIQLHEITLPDVGIDLKKTNSAALRENPLTY